MPIYGTDYPFTSYYVNSAPDVPGVYQLDNVIYYGSSGVSIRSRLQSHLAGYDGKCTQLASTFRAEPNAFPVTRERQLLTEYQQVNGRLPRCNSFIP